MIFSQQLHRVTEAHAFRSHHPLDHVSTATARAQTVPEIFLRADHQARRVVFVKGQSPMRSAPWRFSFTPRASTRRSRETSRFSRSISSSAIRAIGGPPFLRLGPFS